MLKKIDLVKELPWDISQAQDSIPNVHSLHDNNGNFLAYIITPFGDDVSGKRHLDYIIHACNNYKYLTEKLREAQEYKSVAGDYITTLLLDCEEWV